LAENVLTLFKIRVFQHFNSTIYDIDYGAS
jgi:hypothetical protein